MGRKKRTPREPSQIELRIATEFEQIRKAKQLSIRIARMIEDITPADQRTVLLQVISACSQQHPEQWGPVATVSGYGPPTLQTAEIKVPLQDQPTTSVCASGT